MFKDVPLVVLALQKMVFEKGDRKLKLKWIFVVVFAVVQMVPFCVMAQDNSKQQNLPNQDMKSLYWTFSFGLDFGGDTMVTVIYTDGHDNDIKAGELAYFNAGVIIPNGTSDFETQFTIGWKFDKSSADNGDVSFDRFPIEMLEFYKLGRFRFGGGLTYHLNPSLDGDGVASAIEADFDDALGFVLQVDFLFRQGSVGLKYTDIEYQVEGSEVDVDGNSIGIVFGLRF